jgi:hypothetical protein
MMTLFADLDLARRLEDADAWLKVAYAEAQAALDPAVGATSEAVGGGYAAYVGSRSPLSRAVGLGMHGPVGAAHIPNVYRHPLFGLAGRRTGGGRRHGDLPGAGRFFQRQYPPGLSGCCTPG